jgi:multiple sugar transport system permease protein
MSVSKTRDMSGNVVGSRRLPDRLVKFLGKNPQRRAKYLFCYAMLAPVMLLFGYIRVYPIVRTFILSFYKYDMMSKIHPFIGLLNYQALLHDSDFLQAIQNTTIYAFATVILSIILSLPLAIVLAGKIRFSPLYQTIFFLPFITPMVAMAVAWKWIYDPTYGILNYFLSIFHISAVGWLVYPATALWAIIAMSVWKVIGYNMVLFLVGIKNIPATYYEAATLDGANGLNLFRYITFPLLRPMTLFVLVTSMINAYNVFTQIYVMTLGSQSAPGSAVRVLVFEIYTNAFSFFKMGYASAEAVVLTMIVLVLTILQFRYFRTGEE